MKSWLRPPRLRIGAENEAEPRHATWLELFYDLVFVVAVAQLAHKLSADVSIAGFSSYVLLFIPVWWAWVGTTFYANRFDSDDIGQRLLTGLQMLAIAALAINIHDGLGESSTGFALSYTVARTVLVLEYLRAGHHIPVARGLANRYAFGFAIAALVWLVSAFVPPPLRFGLWAVGMAIDIGTPLFTPRQLQRQLLPHPEHLPERFGLFTIIVLGEAIIAVVDGVAEMHWNGLSEVAAILGFCVAFCLWWVYFENVGATVLRAVGEAGQIGLYQLWLYTHLPLMIGLAATGVGVEHVIMSEANVALSTGDRWLLCGSIALCYLSLAVLHRTGVILLCKARTRQRLGAVAVLLALAIVGTQLLPIVVMAIAAAVCAVQVVFDLRQGRPEVN